MCRLPGVIALFCEPHHGIFLLVNLRPRLAAASLVDRKCDDHGRGAMPAFRRPPVEEALHESGEPGYIERIVFHVVGDVVGPGLGHLLSTLVALVVGHGVVIRLALRQQFNGLVNPFGNLCRGRFQGGKDYAGKNR